MQVYLGRYRNHEGYLDALGKLGVSFSGEAAAMAGAIKLARNQFWVSFVAMAVCDLGFPEGATDREIVDRAKSLGLDLLPKEAGLALAWSVAMQGERCDRWIVMSQPLVAGAQNQAVYCIASDSGSLYLETTPAYSQYHQLLGRTIDCPRGPDEMLIFRVK